MAPPSSLRPALVALAAVLLTVAPVAVPTAGPPGRAAAATPGSRAPASAAPVTDASPLRVRIGSLSPSTIPRRGPVRVTGTVTNRDDVTWTSVRVYAFVSDEPLSSRAELAAAAEVDVTAPVGARILVPGSYDTLGRIRPGETVSYSLRVPRESLPDEPGVYWFGAHALGQGDGPVDAVPTADGRARTFLPLPRPGAGTVETSLVLPLRREVLHTPTGAVAEVRAWTRVLRPGGRLWELLDLVAGSGPGRLTWLVDPAVLDAIARLAAGNPDRSLEPTVSEPGSETEDVPPCFPFSL